MTLCRSSDCILLQLSDLRIRRILRLPSSVLAAADPSERIRFVRRPHLQRILLQGPGLRRGLPRRQDRGPGSERFRQKYSGLSAMVSRVVRFFNTELYKKACL